MYSNIVTKNKRKIKERIKMKNKLKGYENEILEGKSIKEVGIESTESKLSIMGDEESEISFDECMDEVVSEIEKKMKLLRDYQAREKDSIGHISQPNAKSHENITIRELEMRLNRYWECDEIDYDDEIEYSVKVLHMGDDELITLLIVDNDDNKVVVKVEAEYTDDTENLIQRFISKIYDDYINPYNKDIKPWKQFSIRKVESMKLWLKKGNQDKVNNINLDIVEKYDRMVEAKNKQNFYKKFTCMLYSMKGNLEKKIA